MCFKNVFIESSHRPSPPSYDPNQPVDVSSTNSSPNFGNVYVYNSMEASMEIDNLLNSTYDSSIPQTPMSLIDSPSSADCASPMSDHPFVNCTPMNRHGSTSSLLGRRPVYNGHTRPPEYMYHSPPPFSHSPFHGFYPLQVLPDIADGIGNQFSPGSDIESKYGIVPSTSLQNNSGIIQGPQTLCKVCGDVASGNHFGVQSCEACKSFFRRSVRAGARYACRANRMCAIEKHTRNRCQYCRLQKCVQRGMRREAVQEERTPPVSKLQRATTPTQLGYLPQQSPSGSFLPPSVATSPIAPNNNNPYNSFENPPSPGVPNFMIQNHRLFGSLPNLKVGLEQERMQPFSSNFFPTGLETYTTTNSRPNTPGSFGDLPNPQTATSSATISNVSPSVLVEADMQTDMPPENVTSKEGGVKLEDIFEGARQSLLRIIEWGKRIPAFMSLCLDDQVKLLKSSWCEHVLLKLSTRINAKNCTLVLSSGITCHKDQIEDPEVRKIIERVANDVSYWLDMMHIDRVEMACLKGIILFNPDAKGLGPGSRKRVELFQEQILQALETRCRTVYPVTPLRFSKLLLRLAPLKAASLEATQHMEVQRTLGNTKMDNIFNELLDFD